jgi:hypothetical protein
MSITANSNVAGTSVMTFPVFNGQSMFNPKDVAVASGFAVVALGLCLLAQPATPLSLKRSVASGLLVALGMFVMMGTRPGTWPAMLAGFFILAVGSLLFGPHGSPWSDRWRRALARGAVALAGLIVGWVALTFIYPMAFDTPRKLLAGSFSSSEDYAFGGVHLRSGYSYIPEWLVIQIPTLLLVISLVGVVVGIMLCVKALLQRRLEQLAAVVTAIALVGAQLILIPLFTIVEHSVLYNGLRQLLFILPALAIFFVIGAACLFTWHPNTYPRVHSAASL